MPPQRANRNVSPTRPQAPIPLPGNSWPAELPSPAPDSLGLAELLHTVWRRKLLVVSAALLGLIGGLAASVVIPPVYRAHTSLQLEGFNENYFLRDVAPISPLIANASADTYLQNQVRLLESDTLARRVGQKLNVGLGPADRAAPRLPLILRLRRALGLSNGRPAAATDELQTRQVRTALSVRTSLQSQVIDLYYDAADPERAAAGANTAADEFIALNRESRWQLVQDTTEWLSKQTADLKAKLERSNGQLQRFARSAGLVFSGKQTTLGEDRARELEDALAKAEADRATKQANYEAARSSPAESLPDPLVTPQFREYQTELQTLRRKLADLRVLFTPEHYKIRQLKAQIAQIETAMTAERRAITRKIRTGYAAALGLERLLSAAHDRQIKLLLQQSAKSAQYDVLKREVDTTQQLYDSMLQKVKEAGVASALGTTNIRVIDRASPPSHPYTPKLPLNLAIGLAFGCLGGLGLVFFRERSDAVRRPGDAAVLDLPELGVIPSAKDDPALDHPKRGLLPLQRKAADLELVTWNQETSLLSESFRAALASILFASGGVRGASAGLGRFRRQVVVITSIEAMEGKTTVLSNLGIALAETKRRVLLVDADLRRPRLHSIFGLCNDWGLTDLVQRAGTIASNSADALALPTSVSNLWVLPSGPGTATISHVLYSGALDKLLQRFRSDFDLVLVDTPPILFYPDARLLGRLSDGVVLVVRANRTTRERLKASYQQLTQDGCHVLGTVLNDWRVADDEHRSASYKDYYRYYTRPNGNH